MNILNLFAGFGKRKPSFGEVSGLRRAKSKALALPYVQSRNFVFSFDAAKDATPKRGFIQFVSKRVP